MHYVTYEDSVEQNLMALVLTKERLNEFIKTGEVLQMCFFLEVTPHQPHSCLPSPRFTRLGIRTYDNVGEPAEELCGEIADRQGG